MENQLTEAISPVSNFFTTNAGIWILVVIGALITAGLLITYLEKRK